MINYLNMVRAITEAHRANPSLGIDNLTRIGIEAVENDMTGIERKQAEEAQAKLERMRWERTHFSDGSPVSAEFAPGHSSFGVLYEDEI